MEKILGVLRSVRRYSTAFFVLAFWWVAFLTDPGVMSTDGMLYFLLFVVAYRHDRETNLQNEVNDRLILGDRPGALVRAALFVLKKKQEELKRAKDESETFKNMYLHAKAEACKAQTENAEEKSLEQILNDYGKSHGA